MAEEGGLPTWGSANVNTAIVVSLGAGLATGIGGAVAVSYTHLRAHETDSWNFRIFSM